MNLKRFMIMDAKKIENIDKIVNSWISSSDENFDTMLDMYKAKRYSWAMLKKQSECQI